MARVLADTNVLFPFSLMDLMLALSQDRIHTLLWSNRLLDEWERVIVREQHRRETQTADDYHRPHRCPRTRGSPCLRSTRPPPTRCALNRAG